ncbi:hypothetical protein ABKA04_000217 [Annulohypoxylon sp. FPYF3050]
MGPATFTSTPKGKAVEVRLSKFMAQNVVKSSGWSQNDHGELIRRSRIELFIPSPPRSGKQMSYKYHLATRNFIAFIFRRSVVGEHLGAALVTLMHSMFEFRSGDVDNVRDLMDYLDEEGYLNFKNNTTHSLAILHLAETFQLKDLYISAFAHCCGMSDQLPASTEYQLISSGTRKLIRCARVEMNLRLGQSANMVGTFLAYELSEAHLGLYAGARAHLERFRTLLYDFYSAKFGSYPPPSVDYRTTVFEIDILQEMRADFEALYQYLVDETFDTSHGSPFLAEGGIYRKLRENTYAALLKATNARPNIMKNGLVRIYRQFEDGLTQSPTRADKLENLGPMDSRKVRWILIYATYQALRQATEIPPEVRDTAGAPYHLCISTADLPPWDEDRPVHKLVRRQTHHLARNALSPTEDPEPITRPPSPYEPTFEIKPDIDYFALTHRRNNTHNGETKNLSTSTSLSRLRRASSWTGSLTSTISRTLTTNRPTAKLTKPPRDRTPTPKITHSNGSKNSISSSGATYHEILVQGYGNGTNDVKACLVDIPGPKRKSTIAEAEEPLEVPEMLSANPVSASTSSSRYSSNSDLRQSSSQVSGSGSGSGSVGTGKTPDTSIDGSAVGEGTGIGMSVKDQGSGLGPARLRKVKRAVSAGAPPRTPTTTTCTGLSFRRKHSERLDAGCGLGLTWRRGLSLNTHSRSRSRFRRHSYAPSHPNPPLLNSSTIPDFEPLPSIQKVSSMSPSLEMPAPQAPTSWDYVKAVMEVKATSWMTAGDTDADDVHPEWEQYNDLGGLTEVHGSGSGSGGKGKGEGRRLVKAPPVGRIYF